MNQKNLHLHALPIVMISVSAFLIVTTLSFRMGIVSSSTRPVSIASASSALTTNLFKIKTYRNGLASIHLSQTTNPATPAPKLNVGENVISEMSFNMAMNQSAANLSPRP